MLVEKGIVLNFECAVDFKFCYFIHVLKCGVFPGQL